MPRRDLLKTLASATFTVALAGCGGDSTDGTGGDSPAGTNASPDGGVAGSPDGSGGGQKDRVDEIAERALRAKEEAGAKIESTIEHAQEENWEQCLEEIEEVPTHTESARQDAQQALELAESGGYSARVEALRVLIDLIELFSEVQTELDSLCNAGSQGDNQEVGNRWETIRALVEDIEQKDDELTRIMRENSN